jgi:hypothetical protein
MRCHIDPALWALVKDISDGLPREGIAAALAELGGEVERKEHRKGPGMHSAY